MSLDVSGFSGTIQGGVVAVAIEEQHPLIKLANRLPWEEMLLIILPDLQRTQKRLWWKGRPLRVRVHLSIYILQQLYNLTDRQAEYALKDNAAFRLFCGIGVMKHWHAPDHTKLEEFRSRLLPETQRALANLIAVQAVKLNYACPTDLDIDSTVQEANITYPSAATLLIKVGTLAKRLVYPLNEWLTGTGHVLSVNLTRAKAMALKYFQVKRKQPLESVYWLKMLWREMFGQVMPVLKESYQLIEIASLPRYWALRRAIEQLQWQGFRVLEHLYDELFEGTVEHKPIYSLHAQAIHCFDKNKLNKKKEYGRAYQLGRIAGNFLMVSENTSLHMPDAASLPAMIAEHNYLFGHNRLTSIATDKGYYALANEQLLKQKSVSAIYLPRPQRTLNAPRNTLDFEAAQALHNRRAGIEPLIGHLKHGWQMGRSRMKSDLTTLSAGYCAVLGFNLRQLTRYLIGRALAIEG